MTRSKIAGLLFEDLTSWNARLAKARLVTAVNAIRSVSENGRDQIDVLPSAHFAPISLPLLDRYRHDVGTNNFNVMFRDGAISQLSYVLVDGVLSSHRLCFTPCPVAHSDDERGELTLLEFISELSDGELLKRLKPFSQVRFDYDLAHGSATHYDAHLTILDKNCRIPVKMPLSPDHFYKFIIQHFYPDFWNRLRNIADLHPRSIGLVTRALRNGELFISAHKDSD